MISTRGENQHNEKFLGQLEETKNNFVIRNGNRENGNYSGGFKLQRNRTIGEKS